MAYELTVTNRGEHGVCAKCGTPTDDLFTLMLSDGSRTKQMRLCPSCSKKLYSSVKQKNEQEDIYSTAVKAADNVSFNDPVVVSRQSAPPVPVYTPENNQTLCPNCGSSISSGSAFCNKCGYSMIQSRQAPMYNTPHIAKMESKSIEVSPSSEQETIDTYSKFGWALVSSQEIYNKDSHLESRAGGTYSVTETTNYVKLLFNRDKNMPYYNYIADLENRYYSLKSKQPRLDRKGFVAPVTLLVMSIFLIAVYGLGLIGVAGCGFWIFKNTQHNSKAREDYNNSYAMWQREINSVLEQVAQYT